MSKNVSAIWKDLDTHLQKKYHPGVEPLSLLVIMQMKKI